MPIWVTWIWCGLCVLNAALDMYMNRPSLGWWVAVSATASLALSRQ